MILKNRQRKKIQLLLIFFDVGIGKTSGFKDLLNLEIRYKGDFVASPQFLGGISPSLDKILQNKDKQLEYKFGKACNK